MVDRQQLEKETIKWLWKDMKKGNEEVEVYNLAEDISEENNIALLHPKLVSEFCQILCDEHDTPIIEKYIINAVEKKGRK